LKGTIVYDMQMLEKLYRYFSYEIELAYCIEQLQKTSRHSW